MQNISLLFCLLLFASFHAQTLRLRSYFSDNMVLQRDTAFCITGNAAGATSVDAVLENLSLSAHTTVNPNGDFSACFPAVQAGAATSITVSSSNGSQTLSTLTLSNVVFGDVFLCSGQSNMQMGVAAAYNGQEEMANANYPLMRIYTTRLNESAVPLDYAGSFGGWQAVSPRSIDGGNWNYFSATCYFFGRDVFLSLGQSVPVGLLATSYGGTPIEAWSTPESLQNCTKSLNISASSKSERLTKPSDPTVLFNAMIHPYLQMRLKAFIWYQGESNTQNAVAYSCLFKSMIQAWRKEFQAPDTPFYFVQLAAYPDSQFCYVRESQAHALQLPNTGMATAIDLGDLASPLGSIHPRDKQSVGKRLALIARHSIYGEALTSYTGPVLKTFRVAHGNIMNVTLEFDSMSTLSPNVKFNDTQQCTACCSQSPFKDFQVAVEHGMNIIWKHPFGLRQPAGNIIHVAFAPSHSRHERLVGVRYGYSNYAQCGIYNVEGLPAAPFSIHFH